jgi:hypothetical protein
MAHMLLENEDITEEDAASLSEEIHNAFYDVTFNREYFNKALGTKFTGIITSLVETTCCSKNLGSTFN